MRVWSIPAHGAVARTYLNVEGCCVADSHVSLATEPVMLSDSNRELTLISRRLTLALLILLTIPFGAANAGAQASSQQGAERPAQQSFRERPGGTFDGIVDQTSIALTLSSGWTVSDVVGNSAATERGRHVRVKLDAGQAPEQAIAQWAHRPGVESAHLIYRYELSAQVVTSAIPNDPLYGQQPNFDTVQAPAAWDTSTGAGTVVAVIDSGVSPGPDLACHTFVSEYDAVREASGPGTAYDDIGHGTHVTGTVAQCTNNNQGVAGVAHGATIMPINVFYYDIQLGSFLTDGFLVGDAIDWAIAGGADVITMSLGIPCGGFPYSECQDPFVNAALARAKAADIVVMAASGNESQTSPNFPANHPDVMSIGSVDGSNNRASYSNSGAGMSLMAPGGVSGAGILQESFVFIDGNRVWDYHYNAGTSMATPHVAGAAAILRSAFPCGSAAQVRYAMEDSALDRGAGGYDTQYGHGVLQIADALTLLQARVGSCVSPWGPFSSADEFVLQQYRDFLGREGEAAGVAVWTDALVTEALTPEEVIDQFMGSAEFELKVAPIVRLYSATFLRLPDYDGLVNWVNASNAGMPLTVIANEFTTSEEFQIRYGSLSDTDFVELLYQNVLGRGSDPVGLANWVGRLESGQSRGSILVGFSESPEYRANMEHDVVVTMAYVGMLRRAPEPGGFDDWVGQMDAGLSRTDLLTGFFRSTEYASRFQ